MLLFVQFAIEINFSLYIEFTCFNSIYFTVFSQPVECFVVLPAFSVQTLALWLNVIEAQSECAKQFMQQYERDDVL